MLHWSNDRAGIELYMSFEGQAALKVEDVIMNSKGTSNLAGMWDGLDHAFLPIDHHESRYRQFATRRWRTGESMTEYMDELIYLFRKARPDSSIDIQDEKVKNHKLASLPSNVINVVEGYLDLSAADIARKYDIITSQREVLGLSAQTVGEKPLLSLQDKQTGSDQMDAYSELEQILALQDINRPNRFKDKTCTYCNKKGHTETICFAKRDDDKMTKMAEKVSASMAQVIAITNKLAMEGIIETHSKMNLKS